MRALVGPSGCGCRRRHWRTQLVAHAHLARPRDTPPPRQPQRSQPAAAREQSNRRPAISATCSRSSTSASGNTRSRICRLRSRLASNTSSHIVRSMPPVTRAISLSVFCPSSDRRAARTPASTAGSAAPAAARRRCPAARRRGTCPAFCSGKPRFERVFADPRQRQPLRRATGPVVRRHDRRRRRAHVAGAAARAAGIELDADDALAALALERGLHAGRRLAAEQPAAEPDGKSLEIRSTRSAAASTGRPLRRSATRCGRGRDARTPAPAPCSRRS